MTIEEWLPTILKKHLAEYADSQIQEMAQDILDGIHIQETMLSSQEKALQEGRDPNSWLAKTILQTYDENEQDSTHRIKDLSNAIENAAQQMGKALIAEPDTQTTEEIPENSPTALNEDGANCSNKDLALNIAKEVGVTALQSAVTEAGHFILERIENDEPIEFDEVIEVALKSGADTGIKVATASALKIASEKGVLTTLPKGTNTNTFTAIAHLAVENVKIAAKVFTGELTPKEGFQMMKKTIGPCIAGLIATVKDSSLGSVIGSVFGPIGTTVGSFIGGVLGKMAGSKMGQAVIAGAKKVKEFAGGVVSKVGSVLKKGVRAVGRGIASLLGF